MNKGKVFVSRIIFLAVITLVCSFIFMPGINAEEYNSNFDYEIESYHVNIVAHKDNTYNITESIDVYFHEYRHGIYRDIPHLFGEIRIEVSKINTYGEKAKKTWSPSNTNIRLGDADVTIIGDKKYTISYKLDMGKDQGKDIDSIYLDIIGTDWYTNIYSATFNIDVRELGDIPMDIVFHSGDYGDEDTSGVDFIVEDGIIMGRTNYVLGPYQGVTIKADMPEDTFSSAINPLDIIKVLMYSIAGFALICLIYFRSKYGLKEKPIPVVEFYPPDGMTPAEVGYIIDERVDNEDVGAMIIYWASHGHLRIEEGKRSKFTLYKTSEIDSEHLDYEVRAFNKLFSIGDGTKVESKELTNTYYTEVAKIKSGTKKPFLKGKKKLYQKEVSNKSALALLLGCLCIFALAFFSGWSISGSVAVGIFGGFICLIVYSIIAVVFNSIFKANKKRKKWKTPIAYFFYILAFLIGYFIAISVTYKYLSFFTVSALYIVAILVIVIRPNIKKYTEYGLKTFSSLLGFKEFLETAEVDRLKKLFNSDPTYYFDILPYAIALGVSEIWAKKFDDIMVSAPSWYVPYGTGTFTTAHFMRNMTKTTSRMSSTAVSKPSSSGTSSGGFSSGGGFSGGGGGGGGGGSW
jgi:uncharacterized membrane protein YgcG